MCRDDQRQQRDFAIAAKPQNSIIVMREQEWIRSGGTLRSNDNSSSLR